MARGCALGKVNDASGLTEESRYTISRVDAHAEKSPAGVVTVRLTRTTTRYRGEP
jgi:hypothetical protein